MYDEFEKMFGSKRGSPRGKTTTETKGQDIVITLDIDFMEAVMGAQKNVQFNRTDVCMTCKGTKAKPGTAPSKCGGCGGAGYQSMKQGPFNVQQACGMCGGTGTVIRTPCVNCKGRGTEYQNVKEQVNIPRGVDNGVNLRVAKKGHAGDSQPGDLIVQIKVLPHDYFKRDGANIHSDLYVSLG